MAIIYSWVDNSVFLFRFAAIVRIWSEKFGGELYLKFVEKFHVESCWQLLLGVHH